jgi:hypothetical protein
MSGAKTLTREQFIDAIGTMLSNQDYNRVAEHDAAQRARIEKPEALLADVLEECRENSDFATDGTGWPISGDVVERVAAVLGVQL